MASQQAQGPKRPLPALIGDNVEFWTGGQQGELRIYRCQQCSYYVHPPVPFCPQCESHNVKPEPVSGRGVITSFTVNHKQWLPNLPVPYVLALVSIIEQEDVRLVTNIVNCSVDDVYMNMPVKVLFEQNEDVWVPLFEPEATR